MIIIPFILIGITLIWQDSRSSTQVAVSKGGRALDFFDEGQLSVDQAIARGFAQSDIKTAGLLNDGDFGFLYAFSMTERESTAWQRNGCKPGKCSLVTYYDYADGGTLEIVINISKGEVIDFWRSPDSRPGASPNAVPRAIAIAADDSEVRSVLGDIRQAESIMAPMSTWLTDNSCNDNWCVDLVFNSPDGSGEIFHVIVDLELGKVARTFYTRGRLERYHQETFQREPNFEDGCHLEYEWEICWEMTAHDGLNFYNASYQGESIFTSAKIGQVEVFYPSWPGGYRDEIGQGASVRPYYGTQVNDLEEGFEVSQLFTEFLSWPNCICCYRYEQKMRFFADGSFEAGFVSHGPGCDDLSTYRPFWRINLAGVSAESGGIRFWDAREWLEAEKELELPLFERLSPGGEILYTFREEGGYSWIPELTDPSGEDDGRIFVLAHNELEGDGPIATGPADSFWPPGQWLDGEPLSGDNPVLWYVPSLQTHHGDPWWCMPDPEPDYSPCNAVIRAEKLQQPKDAAPTPTPASERRPRAAPLAEAGPSASPTLAPIRPILTRNPRPIAGEEAQSIILNSGCGSCHMIGSLGQRGKVGPDLSNIGIEAGNRVPGQSAGEFIRESILNPSANIASICPNGPCLDNVMPSDYGRRLSRVQIRTLVDFLVIQQRDSGGLEIMSESSSQTTIDEEAEASSQEPSENVNGKFNSTTIAVGSAALILLLSLTIIALILLVKFGRQESSE